LDAPTRLAAARTRLILDKPFLGALALRLELVEAAPDRCASTRSDGRSLFYNRAYIESLDIPQTQFALSREALHCALLHFYRRGSRDPVLWQAACDHAINPLLIDDGLTPTPDTLYMPEFRGMTAEEIYPLLDTDEPQRESRGGGEADSAPEPGQRFTPDEMEMLAAQWRQRLAAAAQQALQAGKLSADMARLVDFFLQPKLPWRNLLAQHLSARARTDYSYTRPSSRRGDPAVFPGLRGEEIDLVVAVDTSGSIRAEEIEQFFSEINAIKGQIRARITLLCCDAEIRGLPLLFEAWDEIRFEPSLSGGGGSDFRPVFEWVERQDMWPEALVYFTDACGAFPDREPGYPTLWLVKGRQAVPFGARIQLND
jgi:predicted metal-dependent peptidase